MTFIEFEGLGGLCHGSFLKAPIDSISAGKPPGTSLPPKPPDSLKEITFKILRGEAFCYSPNLSWFLMAVAAWCVFPYNLDEYSSDNDKEANKAILMDIVKNRLVINHVLALAYIGCWHWLLYIQEYCHRPYVPNRVYNVPKVLHNLFYTTLGILQWTLAEAAFIHLYKSGRLPYVDATANPWVLLQTMVFSMLLPSFRDVHFYFAHRFIHLRPLYKYVHSLHHRNTDVEPFSGLAMHPIEHMYYFTCYHPNLVLPLVFNVVISPFLVFWMGAHLVITPACSHSGYEDHFSADLAHYLHHRYCECNYSGGINIDVFFGTHRATLAEAKDNNSKDLPPPPADSKSALGIIPEHPEYDYVVALMVLWAVKVYQNVPPLCMAIVISMGPAVWAVILALVDRPKSFSLKKAFLSPFDKDSVPSLGFHLGMGFVLGVFPATHLLFLFLQEFH